MKSILVHKYEEIISIDNLLLAWQEFIKGKCLAIVSFLHGSNFAFCSNLC